MNYVSYLIDMGNDHKDLKLIKKGVLRGEKLIKENKDIYSKKQVSKLSYFIANGYMSIYQMEFSRTKGYQQILENKNLQQAKNYYRQSIKNSDQIVKGIKKKVVDQLWKLFRFTL